MERGDGGMIKYFCDRCGAEILFDDVVKVEMGRDRAWEVIGDSLKYKDIILCPKCISAFNEFMQEGKTIDPREG